MESVCAMRRRRRKSWRLEVFVLGRTGLETLYEEARVREEAENETVYHLDKNPDIFLTIRDTVQDLVLSVSFTLRRRFADHLL